MELTDFLLYRIAEDEAVGESAVRRNAFGEITSYHPYRHQAVEADSPRGSVAVPAPGFLAECNAKRRIVEEHYQLVQYRDEPPYPICPTCSDDPGGSGGSVPFPCPTLGFLALPYVDHPDYQDEWRP